MNKKIILWIVCTFLIMGSFSCSGTKEQGHKVPNLKEPEHEQNSNDIDFTEDSLNDQTIMLEPTHMENLLINRENIKYLKQKTVLGKGQLKDSVYSPLHGQLIVATTFGLYYYDFPLLSNPIFLEVSGIEKLLLSHDETVLATGINDGGVILWDLSTKEIVRSLPGSIILNKASTFSLNGNYIIARSTNNLIEFYDTVTGFGVKTLKGHTDSIIDFALSPNGYLLASIGKDNNIIFWDIESGEAIYSFQQTVLTKVAFSPDGNTLAIGRQNGDIQLWDALSRSNIQNLKAGGKIVNLCFSPDGTILTSKNNHPDVKLWDVQTGNEVGSLATSPGNLSFTFTPDGKSLITTSLNDNIIRILDIQSGTEMARINDFSSSSEALLFSPDSKLLITGGFISIWDVSTGELTHRLNKSSMHLDLSQDGKILVSAGTLWDLTSNPIHQEQRSWGGILAVIGNTLYLASGTGEDGNVIIWNIQTDELLNTYYGHKGGVYFLASSSNGKLLAAGGGEDNTLYIWDVNTGQLIEKFKSNIQYLYFAAFSPDNKMIAVGGNDDNIDLWVLETGELHRFTGSGSTFWSLDFSPDNKIMAAGNNRGKIDFWDIEDGELLWSLGAHSSSVNGLVFSPNGELIASSGYEEYVKLWSIE